MAARLKALNIRYLYDLVERAPLDLLKQRNFGEKSLRELQVKLAALGLSVGMTLDRPSYAAAVTAALVEHLRAAKS